MHRPRGLNDPGGWGCAEVGEQGRTLGYSNPTRSMGVSLSGPHPRSPRHFPRLGFPSSAGVWEHCTTVARLQSPPCRAASSAHQSSGQISILSNQARYPRPAACCATKKERLALQDASVESLCQNEPRRARVRAENCLLQVSVQRH